jgi:predicted phosphodiesterase
LTVGGAGRHSIGMPARLRMDTQRRTGNSSPDLPIHPRFHIFFREPAGLPPPLSIVNCQLSIINYQFSRRAVLQHGVLILASAQAGCAGMGGGRSRGPLRVGLITDLHYADKEPAGTRHYRETPRKLTEAAARFAQDEPDFVVVLGDLIDAAPSVELEQRYLQRIQGDLIRLMPTKRYYVLGNHCVDTLTKDEFLAGVGQESAHYSFDAGDHHFVVLDACFREDGVPYGRRNFEWTDTAIPEAELRWLREDLGAARRPTIVFAHQRLDDAGPHAVRNAPLVRSILEESGRVVAVFQGHSHRNDYQDIGGIHYTTLVAMVEGAGEEDNGYSVLEIRGDGLLRLSGFRRQSSYDFAR